MKFRVLLCVGMLGLLLPAVSADDGTIPIYEPTTISASGHYVLTRGIEASGPIITIHGSALVVTLDLNGFFLVRTDGAGPVVEIVPGPAPFFTRPGVYIRDGEIAGGLTGINGGDHVSLRNVGFYDQVGDGVDLSGASSVAIVDCIVANSGGRGIVLGVGPRLIGTVVRSTGGTGVDVTGFGSSIRNNTVQNATGAGISIVGSANLLNGNVVRGTQQNSPGVGGHGIFIEGDRNLIERSLLEGNSGYGIFFSIGFDNAYRENMLVGNIAGAVGGLSNRDEGGNIQ